MTWSLESLCEDKRSDALDRIAVALVALGYPRRLGADATAEALATDKRMARKIAHLYTKVWDKWNDCCIERRVLRPHPTEDQRRRGITINWHLHIPEWVDENRSGISNLQWIALPLSLKAAEYLGQENRELSRIYTWYTQQTT